VTDQLVRVQLVPGLDGMEIVEGEYPSFRFPRHAHPHFTISVLTAGEQRFEHKGRRMSLRPGDVVLLNPGETHANEPAGESWSHISLCLSEAALCARLPEFKDARFRARSTVIHEDGLATGVVQLLRRCARADELELQELAVGLFASVFGRHSDGTRRIRSRAPVDIVRRRLEEAPEVSVSLVELAQYAGTSGTSLLRSFARSVGCTPHVYQTACRIDRSKQLLRAGAKIADVALGCGFVDQSHFTHTFKRWLGMTPARYRTQVRGAD